MSQHKTKKAKHSSLRFLDLRWQKTNYSLFLENSELESFISDFNSKIEILNKALNDDLDWWFSPLSARNNFGSPLFHHFLCFQICHKLANSGSSPKICLTDCNCIYEGLTKLKSQGKWQGEITHTSKRSSLQMLLKRLSSLTQVVCHVVIPLLLVKVLFRRKNSQPMFMTLVDTFLLPGKEFSNRYYSGVTDFLNKKEISQVRFVPTFHGYSLNDYFSGIKKLRKKNKRFLLKEEFLTIGDALRSIMHSIRLFRLKIPVLSTGPFDLRSLVKEELERFGGLKDGVQAFMNFYFARRLKKRGVKVGNVLNWYENHGKDRGWNYAFHTFYQQTNTIGYNMIFLSKWHLAFSPLPSERKKKVLPKKILTPSPYLINLIKKNDPKLKVKKTGAFRFHKPKKNIPFNGALKILIPLSYKFDAATNSVRTTRELFDNLLKNSKVNFCIKFKSHPATSNCDLKKLKQDLNKGNEIWTNKQLSEELQTADIVMGEWTFALFESLNAGVPVGILRSTDGLFHSSIPPGCAEEMTVNIDSRNSLMKLLEIAQKRRSEETFMTHLFLQPPSRDLALEVFGFR